MITGPVRFHGYFERDSHLCKNKHLLYLVQNHGLSLRSRVSGRSPNPTWLF
jgi:hypothetical protein